IAGALKAPLGAANVIVLANVAVPGFDLPAVHVGGASMEGSLAATPAEPEALLLAARGSVRAGDGRRALDLIARHVTARAAAEMSPLECVLREIAAAAPELAIESHLIATEEKLRRGDFQGALMVLDGMGIPPDGLFRANWHRLRADALTRAGEPVTAHRELQRVAASSDPSVAIAIARA